MFETKRLFSSLWPSSGNGGGCGGDTNHVSPNESYKYGNTIRKSFFLKSSNRFCLIFRCFNHITQGIWSLS